MTIPKIPAWVHGLLYVGLALAAAVAWLGGRVQSPGEVLREHVTASAAEHDTLYAAVDLAHSEDVELKNLLEGLIRGECIENPRADLARQGLLPTCTRLGISPTP